MRRNEYSNAILHSHIVYPAQIFWRPRNNQETFVALQIGDYC